MPPESNVMPDQMYNGLKLDPSYCSIPAAVTAPRLLGGRSSVIQHVLCTQKVPSNILGISSYDSPGWVAVLVYSSLTKSVVPLSSAKELRIKMYSK